jgi:hypothetical protein
MAEPEVTVQYFRRGMISHSEVYILTDALSHASDWIEQEVLSTGVGKAIVIGDLTKCPNRVDQTHQPTPVMLIGSTLTYSCTDCPYTGTVTVGDDPTALVWSNET